MWVISKIYRNGTSASECAHADADIDVLVILHIRFNPLPGKFTSLNFQPLEVVSR